MLWDEEVNTIIYILNLSYAKDFQGMRLQQAYLGKKPFVMHFITFRCICYAYMFVIIDRLKKLGYVFFVDIANI